jgi:hypothetical protein
MLAVALLQDLQHSKLPGITHQACRQCTLQGTDQTAGSLAAEMALRRVNNFYYTYFNRSCKTAFLLLIFLQCFLVSAVSLKLLLRFKELNINYFKSSGAEFIV